MALGFELLAMAVVIVFICDLSGFKQYGQRWIWRYICCYSLPVVAWLERNGAVIRPLFCSLCMMWWCGLCWLLIRHAFTLPHLALVALIALGTGHITTIIRMVYDTVALVLMKVWRTIF